MGVNYLVGVDLKFLDTAAAVRGEKIKERGG